MGKEPIQTYDEHGNPAAVLPRSQVHADGLWHKAANVLLFRSNGSLVMQLRAAGKDVCPNLWDLSVAEHLTPGESYLEAAHRGLQEELGLSGIQLEPAGGVLKACYDHAEIHDREFQQTFTGISDQNLQPDPAEVSATRDITLPELRTLLMDQPEQLTPWLRNTLKHLKYLT